MRLVGGAMANRPRGPEGSGEASDPPPAAEVECGSIKGMPPGPAPRSPLPGMGVERKLCDV
jgi:hypothetical protein